MEKDENLERALAEANQWALKGDAHMMDMCLEEASGYAESLREDITARADEIVQVGYRKALDTYLAFAEQRAQMGHVEIMWAALMNASNVAVYLGKDITAKVNEIRLVGNRTASDNCLEHAERYAQAGISTLADEKLREAKEYATAAGKDITARAAEILREAQRNEIANARRNGKLRWE